MLKLAITIFEYYILGKKSLSFAKYLIIGLTFGCIIGFMVKNVPFKKTKKKH